MDKAYMSQAEKEEAAKKNMTIRDAINFYNNLRKLEIYDFLTHGFNKADIKRYYLSIGINISENTLSRFAKEIFDENNKKVPVNLFRYEKIIPIEEILEYRKQGLSYAKIQDVYNEKGINITANTIRRMVLIHNDEDNNLEKLDNKLNWLLDEKIRLEKEIKEDKEKENANDNLKLDEK